MCHPVVLIENRGIREVLLNFDWAKSNPKKGHSPYWAYTARGTQEWTVHHFSLIPKINDIHHIYLHDTVTSLPNLLILNCEASSFVVYLQQWCTQNQSWDSKNRRKKNLCVCIYIYTEYILYIFLQRGKNIKNIWKPLL